MVTLAGLLAWQGALLMGARGHRLGQPAAEPHHRPDDTFFDPVVGWILGAAAIVAYAASRLAVRRRREAAGLGVSPLSGLVLQLVVVAAAVIAAVAILNADRGVPLAAVILVG